MKSSQMKIEIIIKGILILLIIQSCSALKNDKEKIWIMMKSDNIDSIIDATIAIEKVKDTSMFEAILYNPYDPRITHRLNYKGMSVYQIKMEALQYLTGEKAPKEITYMPDSSIVFFYRQVVKNKEK